MGEQLLPFSCCFSNVQGIRGAGGAKWTTGVVDMQDIQNGQGMSLKLGPWSRGFKLYSVPSLKDAIGHVVLLWDGTRWWFQSSCVCLPLLSEMLQVDLCTFCLDAWGKSPTRGVLRNHIDPTYKHLQGPNALPHHQENHTPLRAYAIHVESKLVEVDLLEFAIELSPMNRQILMHSYLHDLYMHIYIYLFIDAIYCQPGLIILFHIYIYIHVYI